MPIKFIYFDLGNVLLDFTHERGFEQIARVAGVDPGAVRTALFDTGLNNRYDRGEIDDEQFHAEFQQLTQTQVSRDDLLHAWSDIFDLHTRTVPVAANLHAAGYPLGILSNTCQAHWEFVAAKFGILTALFAPIVTSYEARVMKPDAGIYEHAERLAGVSSAEIFFVDDRQENVDGARKCGWHAALFTSALRLAADLEALGVDFNR